MICRVCVYVSMLSDDHDCNPFTMVEIDFESLVDHGGRPHPVNELKYTRRLFGAGLTNFHLTRKNPPSALNA